MTLKWFYDGLFLYILLVLDVTRFVFVVIFFPPRLTCESVGDKTLRKLQTNEDVFLENSLKCVNAFSEK